MTKIELLTRIAENHNRIAGIMVQGDSAILVGDTLKDLRLLVDQLRAEPVEDEADEVNTAQTKDK